MKSSTLRSLLQTTFFVLLASTVTIHVDGLFELGDGANTPGSADIVGAADHGGPDWAELFDDDGSLLDAVGEGGVGGPNGIADVRDLGGYDAVFLGDTISAGDAVDETALIGSEPTWGSAVLPPANDLGNAYLFATPEEHGGLAIFAGLERLTAGAGHFEFELNQRVARLDEMPPCDGAACDLLIERSVNDIRVTLDFADDGSLASMSLDYWALNAEDRSLGFLPLAALEGEGCVDAGAVCAFTNGANEISGGSWPSFGPDGEKRDVLAPHTFVELGLHLDELIGSPCYASARVRSAGAAAGDLALGLLHTCGNPTLSTDKSDYGPGDTVIVTGLGFAPDTDFDLPVIRPDGSVVRGDGAFNPDGSYTCPNGADSCWDAVTSSPDGVLSYPYILNGISGVYEVRAYPHAESNGSLDDHELDGWTFADEPVASRQFSDAAINIYSQCRNDDGGGGASGTCSWSMGAINQINSSYSECDSVVYRVYIDNLVVNTTDPAPDEDGNHSITLRWKTTKSSKHAFDFLTSWDFSENWITMADFCSDTPNPIAGCTGWAADTFAIPADPFVAGAGVTPPAGQVLTIFNGDITSVVAPGTGGCTTMGSYTRCGTYAGDSTTAITINFTLDPSVDDCDLIANGPNTGKFNCEMLMIWGGHIASQDDWGAGNSATSIMGAPYHMTLTHLDGAAVGMRDLQIQQGGVALCGNGFLDGDEECDDGNNIDDDGCQADCTLPNCGDGVLDDGEECDDGNNIDGDGCQADCMNPICGDGIVDAGEECDDGNSVDGDGCQADCMDPVCGDGILDPGEGCDDGNNVDGDGCQADCTLPNCGDGVLDDGEECDDGNNIDGDGCQGNCLNPICGDGIVDAGEECDDGNNVDGDGCQANCMNPICGDAIVDPGEECDDGDNVDGDGCQADCTLPFCGDGIVDPGEQCDDGNDVNGDGCDNDCTFGELLVVLDDFIAEVRRDGVLLRWSTSSEMDNVGFRILRSGGDRKLEVITPQLIPAKGTELGGASYEFLDTDRPAGTVLYYLEDVDRWGTITRHGPVVVRPAK